MQVKGLGGDMQETSFLKEGGVEVTNARFCVPAQTFAMAGITSVKNFHESPKRLYPIVCGVLGLALLAGLPVAGVGLVVLAVVWWVGQRTKYHILLATSGGEVKALTSNDGLFVAKVLDALNRAIIARG